MAWSGTLVDSRDGVSWSGAVNSDTSPDFVLLGGKYALGTHATGTASATLNVKLPSGSYIACGAAVTAYGTFDLPPGTYQIVVGGAVTASDGVLARVPYRAG